MRSGYTPQDKSKDLFLTAAFCTCPVNNLDIWHYWPRCFICDFGVWSAEL